MWIRITCPNGHALENKVLEKAARSKRCPECGSKVSMWTKVTCPNGHVLKVRTKHGGGVGTCPECKGEVEIPEFDVERIIDLLLPKGTRQPVTVASAPVPLPKPEAKPVVVGPRHLASFSWDMFEAKKPLPRPQSLNCASCGTIGMPGWTVCSNCGQPA